MIWPRINTMVHLTLLKHLLMSAMTINNIRTFFDQPGLERLYLSKATI